MEQITLTDGRKLIGVYHERSESLDLLNESDGRVLGTIPLPKNLIVDRKTLHAAHKQEHAQVDNNADEGSNTFGTYQLKDGREIIGEFDAHSEKITIIDEKSGKSFGAMPLRATDIIAFSPLNPFENVSAQKRMLLNRNNL